MESDKIKNLHAGDECPRCQGELYEVTPKTRDAILGLNATVRSVPDKYLRSARATYVICPFCDPYACGIETTEGFELIDKMGNIHSIHEILGDAEF
jgi:hypothetical protein